MSSGDEKLTLTIRLIRSFVYRNIKHVVLREVPQSLTFGELKERVKEVIQKDPKHIPLRKHVFDTMQLYCMPHEFKPNFLVIDSSLKDPMAGIKEDGRTLAEEGVCTETEFSFFNLAEYLEFMKNPSEKWDSTQ